MLVWSVMLLFHSASCRTNLRRQKNTTILIGTNKFYSPYEGGGYDGCNYGGVSIGVAGGNA